LHVPAEAKSSGNVVLMYANVNMVTCRDHSKRQFCKKKLNNAGTCQDPAVTVGEKECGGMPKRRRAAITPEEKERPAQETTFCSGAFWPKLCSRLKSADEKQKSHE